MIVKRLFAMFYAQKPLSSVLDIKPPLILLLDNVETRLWCLGWLFVVLMGCQGNSQPGVPSLDESDSSVYSEQHSERSLAPPYSLAILPLKNLSSNARLHWLGQSLSEMLTSDLAKWPSLSIVARDALGPVLREQWLQQRGFSSSISQVDLGKIQGVHYLVNGGFHQYGNNLTINLQIVDVETGLVVNSLSVQGSEEEIPRLELNLVMKIVNLFDLSRDSAESASNVQAGQLNGKTQNCNLPECSEVTTGLQLKQSEAFGLHAVHQIDTHLSLERITRHRMQAYKMAEAFWQEGWSTEIGQPNYRVWQSNEEPKENFPLLSLPVSLFMQQNRIADVLKDMDEEGALAFVHLEADGLTSEHDDGTGARQLFYEKVRQPHRWFVRALNEHGELVAAFSKWSWQTESILQMPSAERIRFPMWPQPLMSGYAEFPMAWVERTGQHVTFDAVMIPIPDEQATIVLEPVRLLESGEEEKLLEINEDVLFLLPLKNLIRMKWNPPISESLPVDGYLPANKRTVGALLHLQTGKIVQVQFFNLPHDPLFSRSLEDLKQELLGYCVSCQSSETSSFRSVFRSIRLQLTLVKDLHALRFGSSLQ